MGWASSSGLVFLGAGIGANARYWLGVWALRRFGEGFPWGTLAINVSGSLLIGLFMGLSETRGWPMGWRLLIAVGVLGGYTTFSTFSYETLKLLGKGTSGLGFLYVLGSVAAGLVACWAGVLGAKSL